MKKIITENDEKILESFEYLEDVLDYLDEIQERGGYSDEEMDNNLDVALWRSYVYNNLDSYKFYALSEKILKKVEKEGINNGIWCYRYSVAITYMRKFDEALKYSIQGTKADPSYPWGWLHLGKLYYKFNMIDEAYKTIEKGLEIVPNDYEFLTLKDDIENDRGFAAAMSHYINPEVDQDESIEPLLNIEDEEKFDEFKKRYIGDKKKNCV